MNEKSLRVLEFYKIKEKLKKYAVTRGGKEKVEQLSPYDSIYEVRDAHISGVKYEITVDGQKIQVLESDSFIQSVWIKDKYCFKVTGYA